MTQAEFEKRYVYDPQKDKIGGGGFGVVYKAYDTLRKRNVAIKEQQVKEHLFTLQKEVELCNEIEKHDNIVGYENCYRFAAMRVEMDFATMKFYEDGSLDSLLKNKTLSEIQKSDIIIGVLRGIAHLHKEGVIHRDLKTANVLIDREGNRYIPKIADFGLSRLTGGEDRSSVSNSAIGKTIAYAAPEQIKGQAIKKNVDLWAFGVIAYKILTGDLPFTSEAGADYTTAQIDISKKILNLELPQKLNSIQEPFQSVIRKCWVIDADKRVQLAGELLTMLEAKPVAVAPPIAKSPVNSEETVIEKPVAAATIDEEKTIIEQPVAVVLDGQTTPFTRINKTEEEEKTEIEAISIPIPAPAKQAAKGINKKIAVAAVAAILLIGTVIGVMYQQKNNPVANIPSDSTTMVDETKVSGEEAATTPLSPINAPVTTPTKPVETPATVKTSATSVAPPATVNTVVAMSNPTARVEDNRYGAAPAKLKEEEMKPKGGIETSKSPTLTFSDIDNERLEYEGEMKNNMANGKGKATYKVEGRNKGDTYVGSYINNKRNGQGTYTEAETNSQYIGSWANDRPNGEGIVIAGSKVIDYCPGAGKLKGKFKDGKREGYFQIWDKKGKLVHEGNFVNDVPQDKFPNR